MFLKKTALGKLNPWSYNHANWKSIQKQPQTYLKIPWKFCIYSVHWGVNPPPHSKTPPPLSCQAPLKSANCPSPPFLGNLPLSIGFSWTLPPPKSWIFQWTPKSFSFSIPSYLLKVTNFLGKISRFELLVITKKNIFAYKLFFVIKYFRF